jgi:hypothetical protein
MQLPDDARDWGSDDVEAFAFQASPDELQAVMLRLGKIADPRAFDVLEMFMSARGGTIYEKRLPAVLAGRALLQAGPSGVDRLVTALTRGRPRYRSALIMMLWRAGRGDFSPDELLEALGPHVCSIDPPVGTDEAARRALGDYFAEALVDPTFFMDIGSWLQTLALMPAAELARTQAATDIASLLGEASIRLSRSLLDEYADLIAGSHREETVQRFLTEHPALIDPLAATVLPKLRLGTEYATDFAVRRHDDRWLLVEIEKPQDPIFTAQNDFTAPFTHAYGQVLDFQRWVDDDVAYARRSMPGIVIPRGLLVIGRRTDLSERHQKEARPAHF